MFLHGVKEEDEEDNIPKLFCLNSISNRSNNLTCHTYLSVSVRLFLSEYSHLSFVFDAAVMKM